MKSITLLSLIKNPKIYFFSVKFINKYAFGDSGISLELTLCKQLETDFCKVGLSLKIKSRLFGCCHESSVLYIRFDSSFHSIYYLNSFTAVNVKVGGWI